MQARPPLGAGMVPGARGGVQPLPPVRLPGLPPLRRRATSRAREAALGTHDVALVVAVPPVPMKTRNAPRDLQYLLCTCRKGIS